MYDIMWRSMVNNPVVEADLDLARCSEGFIAFRTLQRLGFLRRAIKDTINQSPPSDSEEQNDPMEAMFLLDAIERYIASDSRVVNLALQQMHPKNILGKLQGYVDENHVAERIMRRDDPMLEDDGLGIIWDIDCYALVVREALRFRHQLDDAGRKRLVRHLMTIREIEAVIRYNQLAFVHLMGEMQPYCQFHGVRDGVLYGIAFPSTTTVSLYSHLCEEL